MRVPGTDLHLYGTLWFLTPGKHARRSPCGSSRSLYPANSPHTRRFSRGCPYRETDAPSRGAACAGHRITAHAITSTLCQDFTAMENGATAPATFPISDREMAHPTGFEPVTYGFGGRHSIQLSYGCPLTSPTPGDRPRSTEHGRIKSQSPFDRLRSDLRSVATLTLSAPRYTAP